MGEKILVFDRGLILGLGELPGITRDYDNISYFFRQCIPRTYFVDRDEAELNESLLQVIPYIVIHHMDTFATYRRSAKGGENRLHDKFSIGLGGHVNIDDLATAVCTPPDRMMNAIGHGLKSCQELAIMHAIRREVYEEIKWVGTEFINVRPQILLYDDRDPVGRVHFGIVFESYLKDTPTLKPSEEEIEEFGWKTIDQLRELDDRLEGWSRMLLDHIS